MTVSLSSLADQPVRRGNYRAVLRADADPVATEQALAACQTALEQAKTAGVLLTASLYRYERMLFLYAEGIGQVVDPAVLLSALNPLLLCWPASPAAQQADRLWVTMQPYYYHSEPTTVADWQQGRHPERRRGRIALLDDEAWTSYVYYHLALMRERTIAGDRYHLISLHENVLFSYFEEPKTMVNLCGDPQAESAVLQDWLAADPESHFLKFTPETTLGTGGNFVFLPCCAGV